MLRHKEHGIPALLSRSNWRVIFVHLRTCRISTHAKSRFFNRNFIHTISSIWLVWIDRRWVSLISTLFWYFRRRIRYSIRLFGWMLAFIARWSMKAEQHVYQYRQEMDVMSAMSVAPEFRNRGHYRAHVAVCKVEAWDFRYCRKAILTPLFSQWHVTTVRGNMSMALFRSRHVRFCCVCLSESSSLHFSLNGERSAFPKSATQSLYSVENCIAPSVFFEAIDAAGLVVIQKQTVVLVGTCKFLF